MKKETDSGSYIYIRNFIYLLFSLLFHSLPNAESISDFQNEKDTNEE